MDGMAMKKSIKERTMDDKAMISMLKQKCSKMKDDLQILRSELKRTRASCSELADRLNEANRNALDAHQVHMNVLHTVNKRFYSSIGMNILLTILLLYRMLA